MATVDAVHLELTESQRSIDRLVSARMRQRRQNRLDHLLHAVHGDQHIPTLSRESHPKVFRAPWTTSLFLEPAHGCPSSSSSFQSFIPIVPLLLADQLCCISLPEQRQPEGSPHH